MSSVEDETYIEIFTAFLEGRSGTRDMFASYWSAYGEDKRVDDRALYEILQRVFYVMEEYDPDPELRSRDSPTEGDVREAVTKAKAALEARRGRGSRESSMTTITRYPALADLMMSGFHQDFWDSHEAPEEVVSTFTGDPIFCALLPLEIDSLLEEFDGPDREERLDGALLQLDNNYDYAEDDLTASAWLAAVRDQVVAETPQVGMIDELVGARVLGATDAKVLTLETDAGSIRYRGGALVRALGRGRVFAPGLGADVVSTAVGETIVVAYDGGKGLRLATRSLQLVSDREGLQPHWEFTPVTS